jgi:hypothetical protein
VCLMNVSKNIYGICTHNVRSYLAKDLVKASLRRQAQLIDPEESGGKRVAEVHCDRQAAKQAVTRLI